MMELVMHTSVKNNFINIIVGAEYNDSELSLTTRALAKEKDFVLAGALSYNIT